MVCAIVPEKDNKTVPPGEKQTNPQKPSHCWTLYVWSVRGAQLYQTLKLSHVCRNKHTLLLSVSEARLWARLGPMWSLRSSQGTQQYTLLHCGLVSERGQQGFELTLKGFFQLFCKAAEALNHSAN